MSRATPATRYLERAGLGFEVLEYDYHAGGDGPIGLHAAEAIGWDAGRVFKTLMLEIDGKPACAVIASNASLSMKKVASALKGKTARLMEPAKAERLTGFHTGGISPFGQKRQVPIVFDEAVLKQDAPVVMNGGKRGMMVCLDPKSGIKALGAMVSAVTQ